MEYKIKDFTNLLEDIAPLGSQEEYDNSGLIVGHWKNPVTGVLLSLDCTEEIVDEAIKKKANLIIAHHPIVFKGLKKLNGKNYVERTVLKAIKNDIAIYAIHTNLDNCRWGVNAEIGRRLGLSNIKILAPKKQTLRKLVFFCPKESAEKVTKAIFQAGGGGIGNYKECSFESEGIGAFFPTEAANPVSGRKGRREKVEERRIEILIPVHKEREIIQAMKETHPYEEVAHEIYPITNKNQDEGAGMVGELKQPMETKQFLQMLKKEFHCGTIRHTKIVHKQIQKVAYCGGAGSFLLNDAKRAGAAIYITGDFKYHEFFDAEDQLIIADIGHFESEQFTPNLIYDILIKKFINFAIYLSEVNTNPIKYF